jgi:thiol-disulfide isomerase/thioredoxin
MMPYYTQYAQEYRDKVLFARIDVSVNLWTGERYGVKGTPTFKFFCQGRPVTELVGAVYPAILKRTVDEVLLTDDGAVWLTWSLAAMVYERGIALSRPWPHRGCPWPGR